MMHQSIEDRRAHRVVTQVRSPVLHDAIGCNDDATAQLVALMDEGLQQRAGLIRDGAGEEQIVEHKQIGVDDAAQSRFTLSGGSEEVAIEEVVGLKILDLVTL